MFRFILWGLAKDRPSAVVSCIFSFNIEITCNYHLSNKSVCSRRNSLSMWVQTCCLECLNMRDELYSFIVVFRKNDLFELEDRSMEQFLYETFPLCCIELYNISKIQSHTTQLMILLRCILTLFYQRHVSAIVMNHLHADYFFLVRYIYN
jgi:hypothetical protein